MSGPWAIDKTPTFIQCRITFRKDYPFTSAPTTIIQDTTSILPGMISEIAAGVRAIGEAYLLLQRSSLEAILRYLHGDYSLKESIELLQEVVIDGSLDLATNGDDSSSDEENDAVGQNGLLAVEAEMNGSGFLASSNANANVPLPKACGALWADNGCLVCFFPPKEEKSNSLLEFLSMNGKDKTSGTSRKMFESFGRPHTRSPLVKPKASILQTIEDGDSSFGSDSEGSFKSSSSSSFSSNADFAISQRHLNPSFAWRGSAADTQQSKPVMEESQKSTGSISVPKSRVTDPKNVISIHCYEDMLPSKKDLAQQYVVSGSDVCDHNAQVARSLGYNDLADVWSFLKLLLSEDVPLEEVLHNTTDLAILVVAQRALGRAKGKLNAADLPFSDKLQVRGSVKWSRHPLGPRLVKAL